MRCPICNNKNIQTTVIFNRTPVLRCASCSAEFLEDYEQNRDHLYCQSYYDSWNLNVEEKNEPTRQIKYLTFKNLLDSFEKIGGILEGKRFLDIGCATGYMLDVAKDKGCDVYGVELSEWACRQAGRRHSNVFNKSIEQCSFDCDFFDIITMTDVLEHVNSPHILFPEIKRILKPGGNIILTSPDNFSWSRRLLGRKWFQFKDEHIIYYNKKALSHISARYGLEIVELQSNRKTMYLDYLNSHFQSYRVPVISEALAVLSRLLPVNLRTKPVNIPISGEFFAVLRK